MTFVSEVKHKGSLAEFLLWVTWRKTPRHRTPIYCLWPHWNVCIENQATPIELHDTQLGMPCKWGAYSASSGSHQACWAQTWLSRTIILQHNTVKGCFLGGTTLNRPYGSIQQSGKESVLFFIKARKTEEEMLQISVLLHIIGMHYQLQEVCNQHKLLHH